MPSQAPASSASASCTPSGSRTPKAACRSWITSASELPKIAAQAGRALRDLRKIAEGAKNDLREGLGPEFANFEIEDLNPKRFVQKQLLDDLNADPGAQQQPARPAAPDGTPLTPGERPPPDPDAT